MDSNTATVIRFISAVVLLGLLSGESLADDIARRAQVEAASTKAFDSLRQEVLALPLGRGVAVGTVIDRYGAAEQFDALLHTAQQLGGTRWVDEQTAQVRLEISGDEIAKFLEGLAEKDPRRLPLPIKDMREHYKRDIMHRAFAATGACTAACVADRLRPDPSQLAWRAVSDHDRVAAIHAARQAAVDRVIQSIQPIDLPSAGQKIGNALAIPAAGQELTDWLRSRPITAIEFRDDLSVQISLAASPADLWPTLHAILEKDAPTVAPHDPRDWKILRQQVETRIAPAVGTALAQAAAPLAGGAVVVIPVRPPAWLGMGLIEADGISHAVGGSKLRTARAAEGIAVSRVQEKLNALPLSPTMTLADAARADPRIAAALQRSLSQTRISRVEYDVPEPGAARALVTLDLQVVWREINK